MENKDVAIDDIDALMNIVNNARSGAHRTEDQDDIMRLLSSNIGESKISYLRFSEQKIKEGNVRDIPIGKIPQVAKIDNYADPPITFFSKPKPMTEEEKEEYDRKFQEKIEAYEKSCYVPKVNKLDAEQKEIIRNIIIGGLAIAMMMGLGIRFLKRKGESDKQLLALQQRYQTWAEVSNQPINQDTYKYFIEYVYSENTAYIHDDAPSKGGK